MAQPGGLEEGLCYPEGSETPLEVLYGRVMWTDFPSERVVWHTIEKYLVESWFEMSCIVQSLWPHKNSSRPLDPQAHRQMQGSSSSWEMHCFVLLIHKSHVTKHLINSTVQNDLFWEDVGSFCEIKAAGQTVALHWLLESHMAMREGCTALRVVSLYLFFMQVKQYSIQWLPTLCAKISTKMQREELPLWD